MQWGQHLHLLQCSIRQDCAIRHNDKSFPASDLGKQNSMQRKLEHTLAVIKYQMDTMRLRLNTDKTAYIILGSKAQLWKIAKQPLTTGNHTIQMSSECKIPWRNARQLAQLKQRHNNEDIESDVKLHMYKSSMEIPHQTGMHDSSTIPLCHPPGL